MTWSLKNIFLLTAISASSMLLSVGIVFAQPEFAEEEAQNSLSEEAPGSGGSPLSEEGPGSGGGPLSEEGPGEGGSPLAEEGPGSGKTDGNPIKFKNPLDGGGITSIEGLLKTLINILIVLATPLIVVFIILAGFKYVTAQGDPTKIEEAKRALVYAIIGGVLIIGASAIATIIANTISAFK